MTSINRRDQVNSPLVLCWRARAYSASAMLFGVSSIKLRKTIEMVVELVKWDEKEDYDRLGLDEVTYDIGGVKLPYMRMPVTPGRNIAIIVEVAARNNLLKAQGINPAAFLDRRLSRALELKGSGGDQA